MLKQDSLFVKQGYEDKKLCGGNKNNAVFT